MSKGVIVLGSDQGVGKTYISGLIMKKLFNMGINVGYYKPISIGGIEKDGEIISKEVEHVYSYCDIKVSPSDFSSYVYKNPVPVHIASEVEKNKVELDFIKNDFNQMSEMFDYLIVEGLSDLCLPLAIKEDTEIMPIDLIKMLDLSVIFVTDSSDACVSKTCLSIHYLLSNDVDIRGIIMNNYDKDSFSDMDNKNMIEIILGAPIMTTIASNDTRINLLVNKIKELFSDIDINVSNDDSFLKDCDINLGE